MLETVSKIPGAAWGMVCGFFSDFPACPGQGVWRVARKELSAYFSSPAAFIFIGVFLSALLFIFFWVDRFFARNIADVRPLFEWMPILLIFLVSAMTMRMWSEERRAGTLEFLLTAPVHTMDLVIGKFLACLGLVGITLALTLPLPITVALLGPLDWGPVAGGYIATLALASAYISIGLFVSSRTDNQIVSLIVTSLICGAFYVAGSDALTSLSGNSGSEILRLLGSGSRFDSIARGVIDLRDIYYYLSIFGVFLVLNLYSLESLRWSAKGRDKKHAQWRLAAALAAANLIAGNFWLGQLTWARADLTEGSIYSISNETKSYLHQVQEPLLIRGYFSAQTHPLLAPLVPRLRDLLKEYEIAGHGQVRVEFVDPQKEPALESEANSQYNIKPVPFQTENKYSASVTNSYFNILVKYGSEFQTLGFRDLIEVKQAGDTGLSVNLRDPEFEITRAVKKALDSYRGSGDLFSSIPEHVELLAFVSADDKLPEPLPALHAGLKELVDEYKASSGGKFSARFSDPDEGGEGAAKQLDRLYGLHRLAAGLLDRKQFWFRLVLKSGNKIEKVELPQSLDKAGLKQNIEAELKRFRPGALRSVALYTPPVTPPMPQLGIEGSGGPTFQSLEAKLKESASVEKANLNTGRVPEQADILFLAAPAKLGNTELFAVDQFLMKGGTVVIAASPLEVSMQGNLNATKSPSGLEDWLKSHGLTLSDSMVLDTQNSPLPIPVEREVAGIPVRQIQLLDYPYFPDVREDGFAKGDTPALGLKQLTLSWAAPIAVDEEKTRELKVVRLLAKLRRFLGFERNECRARFPGTSRHRLRRGQGPQAADPGRLGRRRVQVLLRGQAFAPGQGRQARRAKSQAGCREQARREASGQGRGKGVHHRRDRAFARKRANHPDRVKQLLVGRYPFAAQPSRPHPISHPLELRAEPRRLVAGGSRTSGAPGARRAVLAHARPREGGRAAVLGISELRPGLGRAWARLLCPPPPAAIVGPQISRIAWD